MCLICLNLIWSKRFFRHVTFINAIQKWWIIAQIVNRTRSNRRYCCSRWRMPLTRNWDTQEDGKRHNWFDTIFALIAKKESPEDWHEWSDERTSASDMLFYWDPTRTVASMQTAITLCHWVFIVRVSLKWSNKSQMPWKFLSTVWGFF